MAFSLIYPGCMGDAIEQVRETLRYPNSTNLQLVWENQTQELLAGASGACLWGSSDQGCESEAPLLKIANSVWVHSEYALTSEYEVVVDEYVKQIDFKADNSPVLVNEWVDESTNGAIDEIVSEDEPLFPPTVLLAINSIYLKARWQKQFEYTKTNRDSFYDSASRMTEVSKAHFMNMVEYFDYSHKALPEYQVIDLPFAESDMSMIFVLPMNEGADAVSSTDLIAAMDKLESTKMALSLPKFKFESEYGDDLKESLFTLGIQAPFTEDTGALCGLFEDQTDCQKLIIDEIIQKTVIDVNEKGVEAAAVTAISVGVTSMPVPTTPTLMILDHPFQFFIYDKTQDLMLFEGRLGEPEIPEIEPEEALLDALHSADGFWLNAFGIDATIKAGEEEDVTVTSSTDMAVGVGPPDVLTDAPVATPLSPEPTVAAGAVTPVPTGASGQDTSTTDPTVGSGSITPAPTAASNSGLTTTDPTVASGSSTTPPTVSNPSAPDSSKTIEEEANSSIKKSSSVLTGVFLAFALVFAF